MEIKFIKSVEILSSTFKIVWNKEHVSGLFNWSECKIEIGIKSIKKDPSYVFSIISHEVMEIILSGMGARFDNTRTGDNYLFNFDHQTFENAIQIHAQVLSQFIK